MDELLSLLGQITSETESAGKLGALAVTMLVAKYSVDVLRARLVQRALSWVEKTTKMRPGLLQWSHWSDRVRVLVSLGQAFLVGVLGAVIAGAQWGAAVGAGVMAAVASKGLHDTGVMPGRKPSRRGAASVVDRAPRSSSTVSRGLGLQTELPNGGLVGEHKRGNGSV